MSKEEVDWEDTEPHCWKAKLQLNANVAAAIDRGPQALKNERCRLCRSRCQWRRQLTTEQSSEPLPQQE